jgi:uncharacterized OsmC-like protein
MKISLLADDAIRLDPSPGALTIEAPTADTTYSPFQMLASGLASCTFSVLYSWATHAKIPVADLTIDVQWRFAEDPHRISNIAVIFDWPSLPPSRLAAARRVAELCTIHATLTHSPSVEILSANDLPDHDHGHEHDEPPAHADRHDDPAPARSDVPGAVR